MLIPRWKSLTGLIVENDYEERVYFNLVVMYILQHLSFQCYWSFLLLYAQDKSDLFGKKIEIKTISLHNVSEYLPRALYNWM